jgi:hypothetical protein
MRKLGKFTPSFHVLFGVVHSRQEFSGVTVPGYPFSSETVRLSGSASRNDLSGAVGASLDIKASERIAFRLIQADYIRDNNNAGRPQGLRALAWDWSFGLGKGSLLVRSRRDCRLGSVVSDGHRCLTFGSS